MSRKEIIKKRAPLMDAQQELCLKLGHWAYDALGFSTTSSRPTEVSQCTIFKDLCKKSNVKLWETVVSKVKRSQSKKKVIDANTAKNKALKVFKDLTAKSKNLDFEILQGKADLTELIDAVVSRQDKVDSNSRESDHSQRMTVLLTSKTAQVNSKIQHLSQVYKNLLDFLEYFKKKDESVENESLSIFKTCKKKQMMKLSTLERMKEIEKAAFTLCENNLKPKNDDEPHNKQHIVHIIFELSKDTSLKTILKCLGIRVGDATEASERLITSLNLRKDLAQLGYNCYDNATGKYFENIEQIEDKIMEEAFADLRLKHLEMEVENSSCRKKLQSLLQTKNQLRSKAEVLIKEQSKQQMVLNLIDTELSIKDYETKIFTLQKLLSEEMGKISSNKQKLEDDLEIIEGFEERILLKHSNIVSTISSNCEMMSATTKCFSSMEDVKSSFSHANLCSIVTSVDIWKDKLEIGCKVFCTLKMESLLSLRISEVHTPYASISLLINEGNPFFDKIKKCFGISSSKSIEYLLNSVLVERRNYEILGNICAKQLDLIQDLKNGQALEKLKIGVFEECLKSFEVKLQGLVPIVKENLNLIPNLTLACVNAEEQLNTWWSLPAYNVTF